MMTQTTQLEYIAGIPPIADPVRFSIIDAARESDDMSVLTIDSDGMICHCNRLADILLNCIPSSIVWQNISTVLPQLKDVALIQAERINPNLRLLSRIGNYFEVFGMNGRRFTSKLYFNDVEDFGRYCLRLIIRPVLPEVKSTQSDMRSNSFTAVII